MVSISFVPGEGGFDQPPYGWAGFSNKLTKSDDKITSKAKEKKKIVVPVGPGLHSVRNQTSVVGSETTVKHI